MGFLKIINTVFQKTYHLMEDCADKAKYQIIPFGILASTTFPIFYFLAPRELPGVYESLTLRLIIVAVTIPLVFKNYWPKRLKSVLPVYWYGILILVLPFFFIYMFLRNHGSPTWEASLPMFLIVLILVTDWLNFLIISALGIMLAIAVCYLQGCSIRIGVIYGNLWMTFVAYILVCTVFSRKKEILEEERRQTMKSMGAGIAHELRTPLSAINSSAIGIKHYLELLIETYHIAKEHKLDIPKIAEIHLDATKTALTDIEYETSSAFTFIDMLLAKVNLTKIAKNNFANYSMTKLINDTLRRYPFGPDTGLVKFSQEVDFEFFGDPLLLTHVFFNLLKNAIYYVKAAGKGDITIWLEVGRKFNKVHFKDTGMGINAKILPKIFDKFYTKTRHGSGIGLAYCKMVVNHFGGKIKCRSKEGSYTEFILSFPKVKR